MASIHQDLRSRSVIGSPEGDLAPKLMGLAKW
jgi:hypothetical protein